MKSYQPDRDNETYDRQFNLFFLSVHPKTKKMIGNKKDSPADLTKICNLIIYDIGNQTTHQFFETVAPKEIITHFFFEKSYDEEAKQIQFNQYNKRIQNNYDITQRPLTDRLLVCQENTETRQKKLWVSKKDGASMGLLATMDQEEDWRLDVYNRIIITFRRDEHDPSIKQYAWH